MEVENDSQLTWEEGFANVIDADDLTFKGPLSCVETITCAKYMEDSKGVSIDDLLIKLKRDTNIHPGYKRQVACILKNWLLSLIFKRASYLLQSKFVTMFSLHTV